MRAAVGLQLLLAGVLLAQVPSSRLQQAVADLQRGDPKGAIATLEPLVASQPADLRAGTLLGMALSAAGRGAEAKARFEQVLKVNPQYAPALRGLAIHEMTAGRTRQAQVYFERLLKVTPAEPVAHLALAEIHYAARRFGPAAMHFEQCGGLYRQDPRNILKFGEACLRSGSGARGEALLEQLPPEPALQFEAGRVLAETGRYAAAARRFAQAGDHPDSYQAGYNLAVAHLKAKQYDEAVRAAERTIAAGHRKAELYNVLGHAHENGGRTKEAYDALRTATEIDPADETNYLDLIAICLDHKNLDLAMEIANVGMKRLPGSSRIRLQQGVVWAMKGQFPEAKTAFADAGRLAPKRVLPQVSLGLVLLQMDQSAEAVEVLRRTAASALDDALVHWFLGEALNRSGAEPGSPEEKEAVAALERSIRLSGDQVQARVLLAKMLLRRGDADAAIRHLEAALKLEPEEVSATYQLAQAYARKGDSKRSKELFAKVSKARAEERDQFTTRGLQMIVREESR